AADRGSGKGDARRGAGSGDLVGGSKDREAAYFLLDQHRGRRQDARVMAFGENEVALSGFGAGDQRG
ncbi:MAG: hypothetical protein RBS99_19690, partial [Rhodospirillales bacterium]|nr:hypothetical protein [Rhodospirillales bacterium]